MKMLSRFSFTAPSKLVTAGHSEVIKKELGVFKSGQFLPHSPVQLPPSNAIPGKSGERLAKIKIEAAGTDFVLNGGLLFKSQFLKTRTH